MARCPLSWSLWSQSLTRSVTALEVIPACHLEVHFDCLAVVGKLYPTGFRCCACGAPELFSAHLAMLQVQHRYGMQARVGRFGSTPKRISAIVMTLFCCHENSSHGKKLDQQLTGTREAIRTQVRTFSRVSSYLQKNWEGAGNLVGSGAEHEYSVLTFLWALILNKGSRPNREHDTHNVARSPHVGCIESSE